ncbi:MAG: hypothetical protein KTQ49_03560 [Candidatus Omnitrophica bacterium]|nr:hypothetical protein [Candidatus Omnitrophota bacterium]
MGDDKKEPGSRIVWGLFFIMLLLHFFVALKWQERFFINFITNSDCFTDAMSWAYQNIVRFDQGFSLLLDFRRIAVGAHWPPLVTIIGTLNLLLVPARFFFLPNFLYLAMTMLGIYHATRFLTGNRLYSMVAAVIFSCYWATMIQLVAFELQLAVAACLAWSFYWYLRSRFFTCFWPSLAAGLFMVLALYCDRVTPAVFAGALFLVPENFKNKKAWGFMAVTMILVAVCAWPFYRNWVMTLANLFAHPELMGQIGDVRPAPEVYREVLRNGWFLSAHLSYYFVSLTEKLLGYCFTALLVSGLFFLSRLRKPYAQVLWAAVLVPLIVFIAVLKKDHFYIFPLCVYFAIISGAGLCLIRTKWFRSLLLAVVTVLAITQSLLLFDFSARKTTPLFSHQFKRIKMQTVPRLFLDPYAEPPRNYLRQVYFVVNKVSSLMNRRAAEGDQEQALIVDLQGHYLQHVTVFLLRTRLQRAKVINAFYNVPPDSDESCLESSLYLLSNKTAYAGDRGPGSRGCSWKALELLGRLSESDVTLYRVLK